MSKEIFDIIKHLEISLRYSIVELGRTLS